MDSTNMRAASNPKAPARQLRSGKAVTSALDTPATSATSTARTAVSASAPVPTTSRELRPRNTQASTSKKPEKSATSHLLATKPTSGSRGDISNTLETPISATMATAPTKHSIPSATVRKRPSTTSKAHRSKKKVRKRNSKGHFEPAARVSEGSSSEDGPTSEAQTDIIRCVSGCMHPSLGRDFEGLFIGCEECDVWMHAPCIDITSPTVSKKFVALCDKCLLSGADGTILINENGTPYIPRCNCGYRTYQKGLEKPGARKFVRCDACGCHEHLLCAYRSHHPEGSPYYCKKCDKHDHRIKCICGRRDYSGPPVQGPHGAAEYLQCTICDNWQHAACLKLPNVDKDTYECHFCKWKHLEDDDEMRCVCGKEEWASEDPDPNKLFDTVMHLKCDDCGYYSHGPCVGMDGLDVPKDFVCHICSMPPAGASRGRRGRRARG